MEHLSTATVNAIVKQIKDLQKNPAEGITVRVVGSFFSSVRVKCAREREREREKAVEISLSLSLSVCFFFFFFFPSLLLLLLLLLLSLQKNFLPKP